MASRALAVADLALTALKHCTHRSNVLALGFPLLQKVLNGCCFLSSPKVRGSPTGVIKPQADPTPFQWLLTEETKEKEKN